MLRANGDGAPRRGDHASSTGNLAGLLGRNRSTGRRGWLQRRRHHRGDRRLDDQRRRRTAQTTVLARAWGAGAARGRSCSSAGCGAVRSRWLVPKLGWAGSRIGGRGSGRMEARPGAGQAEVVEDDSDHLRVGDGGDEPHAAAAPGAAEDVEAEGPGHQVGPLEAAPLEGSRCCVDETGGRLERGRWFGAGRRGLRGPLNTSRVQETCLGAPDCKVAYCPTGPDGYPTRVWALTHHLPAAQLLFRLTRAISSSRVTPSRAAVWVASEVSATPLTKPKLGR